jgi:hypothetical protein
MNANAFEAVLAALRSLGVRYSVVGSVASSARGAFRATIDTDVVAEISPHQAARLPELLGPEWYGDADQARASVLAARSFNVIHIRTGEKFDIFPAFSDFHASELDRATDVLIHLPDGEVHAAVSTAEDILLAKLRWYADGGGTSDRQWNDIGGIIATNPDLDLAYVEKWAARLKVSELLNRAFAEANPPD